jgi:hypothetical protein
MFVGFRSQSQTMIQMERVYVRREDGANATVVQCYQQQHRKLFPERLHRLGR